MEPPIAPGESLKFTVIGKPDRPGLDERCPRDEEGRGPGNRRPVMGKGGFPVINVTDQKEKTLKPWRSEVAADGCPRVGPARASARSTRRSSVRLAFVVERPANHWRGRTRLAEGLGAALPGDDRRRPRQDGARDPRRADRHRLQVSDQARRDAAVEAALRLTGSSRRSRSAGRAFARWENCGSCTRARPSWPMRWPTSFSSRWRCPRTRPERPGRVPRTAQRTRSGLALWRIKHDVRVLVAVQDVGRLASA
jgi:hypothetical protein